MLIRFLFGLLFWRIVTRLGLSRLLPVGLAAGLAAVTGLEKEGFVSRSQVKIDGKPAGVFSVVADKPLSETDLAPIPKDATLALAVVHELEAREGHPHRRGRPGASVAKRLGRPGLVVVLHETDLGCGATRFG